MHMAVFNLGQNYTQQQSFDLNEVRDYVDVICTFSCKLCCYSSTSPDAIWHHVVETHLNARKLSERNINPVSPHDSGATCSGFSNVGGPVSAAVFNSSACDDTIVKLPSNTNECESDNKCNVHANKYSNDSPLTSPDELLERLNQEHIILTEALTVSAEENYLSNFNTEEQSIPEINQVIRDSEVVVEFHKVDAKDDAGQEIFICCSCGTGFTSTGMVENRSNERAMGVEPVVKNISCQNASIECSSSFPAAVPTSQSVSAPNFTSTGTQVQLVKKPGRKRKVISDGMSQQSNAHVSHDKSNPVENSALEIYDNIKASENEYISGNTDTSTLSSKRQIRPPRSLVKDYHIVHPRHWKRHLEQSEVVLKFKCMMDRCDALFNTQEGLSYHSKCHEIGNNSILNFSCRECQKPFQTWIKLRAHLQVAHKVVVDWFYCSGCDFSCESASLLEEHNSAVHSSEILSTTANRARKYCSKRSGSSAVEKSDHSLSINNECNICKRTFANRKSLLKHIEVVHEKLKAFICSMCGYSSARKATLQLHMRIHTGEKPFRCDLCVFSASDHNTLRRHRMRHTGQKAYSCSFCMYTCIQAASLKLHVRSKHPHAQPVAETSPPQAGTAVFACSVCSYQTVNQRSYLSHVTNHESATTSSFEVIRGHEATVDDLTLSLGDDSAVTCSISASRDESEASDIPSYSVQFTDQFSAASSSTTFTVLSYQAVEANSNHQLFSVLPPP